MPIRRRHWLTAAAALALATTASAQSWGGGEQHEKAMRAMHEKARAAGESQVVVYGAFAVTFKPLWDLFSARFPGISVVGTPISGSAMLSKIDAEVRSGQRAGDIIMSGATDIVAAADMARTESFVPPNARDALAPEFIDPQGRFVLNYAGLVGFIYNTDKLAEKDLPRTLADLTQPRFKGMVVDDPFSGALTTIAWTHYLRAGKIDASWIKAVKPNLTIVPTTAPYYSNISTGAIAVLPFNSFNRYVNLKKTGAKVGFVATPGMSSPSINGMAIVKNPPHPRAAELLMAWFLSPEAQNAIGPQGASYPLAKNAAVPADWPSLKDIMAAVPPLLPGEYQKARAEYEKLARDALR
jgi:iron(III) transport system substrate-binding protein